MKSSKAVIALAALAQDTRLRVYRELVKAHVIEKDKGGLSAGLLVKKLKVPPPTMSFHLKELSHAGLVLSRREGRSIIYKANLDTMGDLVTHLLEDCCGGACDISIQTSPIVP
jgi:DNA-binding transcriptional ArsR family regulator